MNLIPNLSERSVVPIILRQIDLPIFEDTRDRTIGTPPEKDKCFWVYVGRKEQLVSCNIRKCFFVSKIAKKTIKSKINNNTYNILKFENVHFNKVFDALLLQNESVVL